MGHRDFEYLRRGIGGPAYGDAAVAALIDDLTADVASALSREAQSFSDLHWEAAAMMAMAAAEEASAGWSFASPEDILQPAEFALRSGFRAVRRAVELLEPDIGSVAPGYDGDEEIFDRGDVVTAAAEQAAGLWRELPRTEEGVAMAGAAAVANLLGTAQPMPKDDLLWLDPHLDVLMPRIHNVLRYGGLHRDLAERLVAAGALHEGVL